MQFTFILCISIIYCFLDLFVIKRQLTSRAPGIYFLNYFVSYLWTDLRNNSLSNVSSVIRQRREVRTWAAAEKIILLNLTFVCFLKICLPFYGE